MTFALSLIYRPILLGLHRISGQDTLFERKNGRIRCSCALNSRPLSMEQLTHWELITRQQPTHLHRLVPVPVRQPSTCTHCLCSWGKKMTQQLCQGICRVSQFL